MNSLLLGVLLSHLGTYMIAPLLPIFLKLNKGLPVTEIGLVLAAASIIVIFFAISDFPMDFKQNPFPFLTRIWNVVYRRRIRFVVLVNQLLFPFGKRCYFHHRRNVDRADH